MFHIQSYDGRSFHGGWEAAFLILCLGCFSCGCSGEVRLPSPMTSVEKITETVSLSRPPLPGKRDQNYSGSAACIECHPKICEDYGMHPMGQSVLPVDEATKLDDYPDGWLDIPGPLKYKVEKDGAAMLHYQCQFTDSEELVYEQKEEIAYCVGSGENGRAYLVKKGKSLFQSPLGWYAGTDSWDLSPGYRSEGHFGFTRPIDNSCLYCHAGRVNSEGDDKYGSPTFLESVIGCERCHGPADNHINYHRQEGQKAGEDPIVNPVDLTVAQREDVCNQCHLQSDYVINRYGRDFFDFRPGDRLEDVFVVLSAGSRGRNVAVSHVEQMRESVCYTASSGELGCISCHDPHRKPAEDQKVSFYRDACLECHAEDACDLDAVERHAEPYNNSCYVCHMPSVGTSNVPHTAQTDHRIVRKPLEREATKQVAAAKQPQEQLTIFDDAEQRLPEWEVDRARGMALMSTAWKTNNRKLALDARRYLLGTQINHESNYSSVISKISPDVPALAEIGASYWIAGPKALARPYWEKVLELAPENQTALGGLALLETEEGNLDAADRVLKRLIEAYPHNARWRVQRAKVLQQMDKTSEAKIEAAKALELDPSQSELRAWISQVN